MISEVHSVNLVVVIAAMLRYTKYGDKQKLCLCLWAGVSVM